MGPELGRRKEGGGEKRREAFSFQAEKKWFGRWQQSDFIWVRKNNNGD